MRIPGLVLAFLGLVCGLAAVHPAFGARIKPAEQQTQDTPVGPVQSLGEARQPRVAFGPDGRVHVVMLQAGNVVLCTSSDGGQSFGDPVIALDAKGNARGGLQRGPRIGVSAAGEVVISAPICDDEVELQSRHPRAELWVARSTDGGKSFAPRVRVNEIDHTAAEALHDLAVAEDGTAHLVWLDHRREATNELWTARFEGAKVSTNLRISGPVCECCAPGVHVDPTGVLRVAVREKREGFRRTLLFQSSDGGRSFTAPTALDDVPTNISSCPMDAPAISADGQHLAIAWMDERSAPGERDVFWQLDGDEILPLHAAPGLQGHVSLAMLPDGTPAAVWTHEGSIVLRTPTSPPRPLSPPEHTEADCAVIAIQADRAIVVWECRVDRRRQVFLRRLATGS